MRTTVTLDDEVYSRARRIAFESRRSLGDVLSELVAVGLAVRAQSTARELGTLRGSVWIADDFDATPAEVDAALDAPV